MNERRGSGFTSKQKSGLRIIGERINPSHSHRVNHYFGKGRYHGHGIFHSAGSSHFQRIRRRGCNGRHSPLRSTSFKANLNTSTSQPGKCVSSIPPKEIFSKQAPNSTSSVLKSGSVSEKPKAFVCDGIEVNFDSSDSEEDVRPWRVLKVLRKSSDNIKNEGFLQRNSHEQDGRGLEITPRVQGKVLQKHDSPKDQTDEGQGGVSAPVSYAAVVNPQTSVRPSYVVLSGLRKQTTSTEPMSNCAIIKRSRLLFSQQIRPSISHYPSPSFPFPRFQKNTQNSIDKNADLNLLEFRIIEDVLDMMEEVEMRARYSNKS